MGGIIQENEEPYQVDSEIGRFTFKTHYLNLGMGNAHYNTSKDVFKVLRVKEWYRTEGFNELAFGLVKDLSYRKSAAYLNRIRWQMEGGTPQRTLANTVEIEGMRIEEKIDEMSTGILIAHQFDERGTPNNPLPVCGVDKDIKLPQSEIAKAIEEYNANYKDEELHIGNEVVNQCFEDSKNTVNISIDDVGVKEQKEKGRDSSKQRKNKRKYVHNTITHIENCGKQYVLNGRDTISIIPLIIAFLLHNALLGKYIQFYVDGARVLQNAIFKGFSWLESFGVILDWYHLKKKCEMELSLALKNSQLRNELLDTLLPQLWLGKVDKAIDILRNISKSTLKSGRDTEGLIGYFERNRDFIPCYALRKKLGLRNSSNRGEKENDIIVSERQKHNGMSWSKDGSVSLATISALYENDEQKNWFKNTKIEFKMVA